MSTTASLTGPSGAVPKAQSRPFPSPSLTLIASPSLARPVSTLPLPHKSAGATPSTPSSSLASTSIINDQNLTRLGLSTEPDSANSQIPSNSHQQSQSPLRLMAEFAPSGSQGINEKVQDAFEELELGGISLSQAVYAQQEHTRKLQLQERSREPSRDRSRKLTKSRPTEREEGSARDDEWDEKRRLSLRYGDAPSIPGPSSARQSCPSRQMRPGSAPIQGPARSSSLPTASIPHQSSTPPPYSSFASLSLPSYPYSSYSSYSSSVRRMLLVERLRPWVPALLYAATSLGFILAITFWKEEVFGGLDDLARWLRSEEETGYAVMFFLIFLTCIPPLPLYSTLQILSGYTFGAWTGACISYSSALTGALFVFALSRSVPMLRNAVTCCLAHSRSLKRVVRAISRRPSLLFLVRLAPYPYNVMNALLAGCPRLRFRTYAVCTALSLTKVIIHTSVGAGIKSFAEYHVKAPSDGSTSIGDERNAVGEEDDEGFLGHVSTVAGIALCVLLTIYLSYVARRAVDEELEDDDGEDLECGRALDRSGYGGRVDDEERAAFLSSGGLGSDFAVSSSGRGRGREMSECDAARLSSGPSPARPGNDDPYGPPEWTS